MRLIADGLFGSGYTRLGNSDAPNANLGVIHTWGGCSRSEYRDAIRGRGKLCWTAGLGDCPTRPVPRNRLQFTRCTQTLSRVPNCHNVSKRAAFVGCASIADHRGDMTARLEPDFTGCLDEAQELRSAFVSPKM